jgi:hypothetical protein
MTQQTGGEIVVPFAHGLPRGDKNFSEFAESMARFHQEMAHSYVLELELPEPTNKKRCWNLKFSKDVKARFGGARIVYPTELAVCKP